MMPDKFWFHSEPVFLLPPGIFVFIQIDFLCTATERASRYSLDSCPVLSPLSHACVHPAHWECLGPAPSTVGISGSSSSRLMGMTAYQSLPLLSPDLTSISHEMTFLPVKGQFRTIPSSSLPQFSPSSSPHHIFKHPPSLSLPFLTKGTKYFEMHLQVTWTRSLWLAQSRPGKSMWPLVLLPVHPCFPQFL